AVEPITSSPPALCFRSGTSGKLLMEVRLGAVFERRFGQPYRVVHRADLHASLLTVAKSLPQIKITMGVSQDATTLAGPIIAADGIWSKTREQLFPSSSAIADSSIIFRAMIDMPQNFGINLECVNSWYYPNAHVVHYPAGRDGKLNVVANSPKHGPQQHFAKADKILRELIARVPNWTEWTPAYVNPLSSWHKDNVLLIGDAAHGTFPFLAQGAAMSLEDAAALLHTTDPAKFEALRRARCTRLHKQTLRVGEIYHLTGLKALMRNAALRFSSDEFVLGRMAWIYGY
ncbi:MAG: FAD-dependent monooxygenase, partial [Aestuariivirga sp.]